MNHNEEDNRSLYRFEYYEPDDNETYIDWVWLKDDELNEYKSNYTTFKLRPATKDEESLYNEAYADGYGVAAFMEFESKYDGITYRIELDENGSLDMSGKKMFECAVCQNHKDFEDEVAMANGFYLGTLKDEKLWHICYDCALLQDEIESIKIELDD